MRLPFRSTALPTPDANCSGGDLSVRHQSPDPAGRRIGCNHQQHNLPSADLPPATAPTVRNQTAEIVVRLCR